MIKFANQETLSQITSAFINEHGGRAMRVCVLRARPEQSRTTLHGTTGNHWQKVISFKRLSDIWEIRKQLHDILLFLLFFFLILFLLLFPCAPISRPPLCDRRSAGLSLRIANTDDQLLTDVSIIT